MRLLAIVQEYRRTGTCPKRRGGCQNVEGLQVPSLHTDPKSKYFERMLKEDNSKYFAPSQIIHKNHSLGGILQR